MPYTQAEMRAINSFKPRPPKKWWVRMRKKVKKQYPYKSEKRISKITAGIWHDYKPKTRRRLIKKYGGGNPRRIKRRKKRTNKRRWRLW